MTDISLDDASTQHEELSTSKFLTFQLKDEIYGIEINHVKEIMEYGKVTRIPLMPEYIRGLINLRGHVLPIVDLSARLGKGKSQISRRSCSLVVDVLFEDEIVNIGIVVDSVKAVFDINVSEIEKTPEFGATIRQDFILGLANVQSKIIYLLRAEHVFALDELSSFSLLKNDNSSRKYKAHTADNLSC